MTNIKGKDDDKTKTVKVTTNNLSGKGATTIISKAEADKAYRERHAQKKKEYADQKRRAEKRMAGESRRRASSTKERENAKEKADYNHITDMGIKSFDTTNATTCGVRGINPVKGGIRKIIGKIK